MQELPQVQFIFLPEEGRNAIRSLSRAEEVVKDFFIPDPISRKRVLPFQGNTKRSNLLIFSTPYFPHINIGHYEEWCNKSGRFFEGFFQHNRTASRGLNPLSGIWLRRFRKAAEKTYAGEGISSVKPERVVERLYLARLILLDKLFSSHPFITSMVRSSHEDFLKERTQLEQGNVEVHVAVDKLKKVKTVQEYVDILRRQRTMEFRGYGITGSERIDRFASHILRVLTDIPHGVTKVLIAESDLFYFVKYPELEAIIKDSPTLELQPPILVSKEEPLLPQKLINRFILDPKAEVDEVEAIVLAMSAFFISAYKRFGFPRAMGSYEEVEKLSYISDREELVYLFGEIAGLTNPSDMQKAVVDFVCSKRDRPS